MSKRLDWNEDRRRHMAVNSPEAEAASDSQIDGELRMLSFELQRMKPDDRAFISKFTKAGRSLVMLGSRKSGFHSAIDCRGGNHVDRAAAYVMRLNNG